MEAEVHEQASHEKMSSFFAHTSYNGPGSRGCDFVGFNGFVGVDNAVEGVCSITINNDYENTTS